MEPVAAAGRNYLMRESREGLPIVQIQVKMEGQPFGMNVKTDEVPFVVHVAEGSPAEAAGVRAGDVVTKINGQPVTAANWYDVYLAAQLPIVLTLDTYLPLPSLRWDITASETKYVAPQSILSQSAQLYQDFFEEVFGDDSEDFEASVSSLPYGLRISGGGEVGAFVQQVIRDSPAEKAGVVRGDVLISIATKTVNEDTWFDAMHDSSLPYRVVFRRRKMQPSWSADELERSDVQSHIQSPILDVDDAAEEAVQIEEEASMLLMLLRKEEAGPNRLPIVRDVDAAAEEVVQENQVLDEMHRAQDHRRKVGLEKRESQLKQAEIEVQEALDKLQEEECNGDEKNVTFLTETLARKMKWRDGLLHDVSMWMSWMEQSEDLMREHFSPCRVLNDDLNDEEATF
jgi:hypothetical protein